MTSDSTSKINFEIGMSPFLSATSVAGDDDNTEEDDLLTADEYWREYLDEMARKNIIEKLVREALYPRKLWKMNIFSFLYFSSKRYATYPASDRAPGQAASQIVVDGRAPPDAVLVLGLAVVHRVGNTHVAASSDV